MASASYEALLLQHYAMMRSWALKLTRNPWDAADLTQETFLQALQSETLFIPGSNIRGWLYTIMRHLFLNEKRRETRRRRVMVEDPEVEVDHLPTPETSVGTYTYEEILDAIDQLPEHQKQVVVRRDVEDLEYHDIATSLAIEEGTMKSRLHRGRKAVRRYLRITYPEH